MSDETRYDDATVQLVADHMPMLGSWHREAEAKAVLDALADAGLLMPPNARVSAGWRVIYGAATTVWSEHWDRRSADGALGRARAHYEGAQLQSRVEITTPWVEVTE